MKLIAFILAALLAWEICERWVFPAYKKPDPPEPPGPDAQKAARQYSFDQALYDLGWLGIKSPSVLTRTEFGHGVLTPNEAREYAQQEAILQAVKDYAEKKGIDVTYSGSNMKGESHEKTETTD